MALELVTGYWGQNHVTAEQEADLNAGIFGSGFYVLPVGEKMRAEAVTSNQVRIFDGIFVGYGRQASIEEGGYENVTIENGTAGLLRNDMIVVKYNKDEESGIESVSFDVLKGQTGSTAQDPVPNNQDIRAGAFESEMPLYRVKLNGLAIEEIEPLFTVPKSIEELMQENAALNSALPVEQIEDSTGRSVIKFKDGTMIQKRRLVIDNSGAFSAWGSSGLYYLRYGLGTYLEEFSDFPAVVVGVENAANILVGNVVSATRQRPGEVVLTKINGDSVAITLNYIAIGRWK